VFWPRLPKAKIYKKWAFAPVNARESCGNSAFASGFVKIKIIKNRVLKYFFVDFVRRWHAPCQNRTNGNGNFGLRTIKIHKKGEVR